MKNILAALALLLPSFAQAGGSARWAPALHSVLPQVTEGPAGEAVRNMDFPILAGLNVSAAEARAGKLGAKKRLSLERSLAILSPVIARLEAKKISPETLTAAALSEAIAAQVRSSNAKAAAILRNYVSVKTSPERTLKDAKDVEDIIDHQFPYLEDALLDGLAKIDGPLLARAEAVRQTMAMADIRNTGDLKDAVAAAPARKESRFKSLLSALQSRAKAFADSWLKK